MPLDLSPCNTGIPRCQPTFDLTKKQFMPHKNVQKVRDMVNSKKEVLAENKNSEVQINRGKPAVACGKRAVATRETNYILKPIGQWWRRVRSQSVPTDSDSFFLNFDNEEIGQFGAVSSPWLDGVVPFSYPPQVTTANEYELVLKNEQEVYQQYYNHPIGPEYLILSHSPQRDEQLSCFRRRQNSCNKHDSWTGGCMGWEVPLSSCWNT